MILIDTSVWIDFLKGADSPQRFKLHELIENREDIAISEIILTEILQGITEEKKFLTLKSYFLQFPFYRPRGVDTYIEAAQIYRACRKRGVTIRSSIDCIIAAICIENELVLLHKDNDYNMIARCTSLKILKA
jgi:predicted nucleic acid-binding protein